MAGIERKLEQASPEPDRMKTFRFGVNVGPSRSRAEWVEKARKLEDLGYLKLTRFGGALQAFQRRLHRCPRHVRPIHLSFVARWSIWFALDVIRPSLRASSSRQRSPSATGLRKPTGKRAAGRRRVAG